MSIALTANKAGDATTCFPGTSVSVAFPSSVTELSLLVACVTDYNQVPPAGGVAKSDGTNTFTRAVYSGGGSNQLAAAIYYLANAPGGPFTVKYTPTASSYCTLSIIEITGAATASPLDNTQGQASPGSDDSPEPDANVTYAGNGAVVSVFGDTSALDCTITVGTGFTEIFQHEDGNIGTICGSEAQIVSGSGNVRAYQNLTVQYTHEWFCCGASFKEAAGGVATPVLKPTMQQIVSLLAQ